MIHVLEGFVQDLVYALRSSRRSPIFVAVAVVSLALGIGANTAVFSVIDALLLKPLPVRDPEHLVSLAQDSHGDAASYALWSQLREQQDVFSEMFAAGGAGNFDLATEGEKEPAGGLYVSGSYFSSLGISAMLGRTLTEEDDRRGSSPVAVISYDFWRRRYRGDPAIVGRIIHLDNHPFEVVGVTTSGFFGLYVGEMFEIAIPVASEPILHPQGPYMEQPDDRWLTMYGRLKPGVDLRVAESRLNVVSAQILQTLPNDERGKSPRLILKPAGRGVSELRIDYSAALAVLMAMVGLVLLMACANLANLLLARAGARNREVAVRLAIGASRGRLIRQFLTESLCLSFAGATLGLVVAQWSSRLMVSWISSSRERIFLSLSPDFRILAFAACLATVTALLFGIVPAVRAARLMPQSALKEGEGGLLHSRQRLSVGRVLVAVQVALSVVLLIGAGLFVRSWRSLLTQGLGFRKDHILLVNADWHITKYTGARQALASEQLLERFRELTGVQAASASAATPLGAVAFVKDVEIDSPDEGRHKVHSHFNMVSPSFFDVLGTPLLAGRDFKARDSASSSHVAIINETAARRFFPGRDPIGRTYREPAFEKQPEIVDQIVGVVRDAKYTNLRREAPPTFYVPIAQNPSKYPTYELRYAGPLGDLIARVKEVVRAADPSIRLQIELFSTRVEDSIVRERLLARLASVFGVLALALATLGLYGLVTFEVTCRRSEIGVRMALGSSERGIVWLFLYEMAALFWLGIPLGLALAMAGSRFVRSQIYGFGSMDLATAGSACIVLTVVGMAAVYFPTRRAARIDPLAALRQE
jgi:predicted permease